MAQDTIKNIRNAEKQAQKLVKDAEAEKATILDQAKTEGEAFSTELIDAATKAAKEALAKVESGMDSALEAAGKKAEETIAGFHNEALAKRDEAIAIVVSEIA
ncbi:MAG: hypothetical protein IKH67_04780 [Lachnospiraceae bacterium]|nr:hypothetical protein [Lachnospiraceae bacterium]MBR3004366.1 hypothetical protein [Lachnospiraceae bacterium]MBR6349107.1 hypothetical protein [Lachnospiraceae bacterium]